MSSIPPVGDTFRTKPDDYGAITQNCLAAHKHGCITRGEPGTVLQQDVVTDIKMRYTCTYVHVFSWTQANIVGKCAIKKLGGIIWGA